MIFSLLSALDHMVAGVISPIRLSANPSNENPFAVSELMY